MKKSAIKTPRTSAELKKLGLGHTQTQYLQDYSPEVLEWFENKNPSKIAWTTFICPEFTSLCPKTGQPDFATIQINYIANKRMVESKSMKLYLFSFRNHGDFHEDCIQTICNDLEKLLKPHYIEVLGYFTPRGGISIYPFASAASNKPQFQEILKHRRLNYSPSYYPSYNPSR